MGRARDAAFSAPFADYPKCRDLLLVGHRMGGLVSRVHATIVMRESWDVFGEATGTALFAGVKKGDGVESCSGFSASPKVDGIV